MSGTTTCVRQYVIEQRVDADLATLSVRLACHDCILDGLPFFPCF